MMTRFPPRHLLRSIAFVLVAASCSEAPSQSEAPHQVVVALQTVTVDTGDSLIVNAAVWNARGVSTGAEVTWSVVDSRRAEVTGSGWLRGLRYGHTLAIAESENATPDTILVNVRKHVTSSDVTPDTVVLLNVGEAVVLSVRSIAYLDQVIGTYTWVSRDQSIVTVDGAGRVHAENNGETYVIAREAGGAQDSALVRVHTPLDLSFDSQTGALHLAPSWDSVTLQAAALAPILVSVLSSDTAILAANPVVIPAGSRSARLELTPRAMGEVSITVQAPGFRADSGTFLVGRPELNLRHDRLSANLVTDYPLDFEVYFGTEFDDPKVGRSTLDTVIVHLRSSDQSVLRDTVMIVPPLNSYAFVRLKAHGAGSVDIALEAQDFIPDSLRTQFKLAKYVFFGDSLILGARQRDDGLLFVPIVFRDTVHTTLSTAGSGIVEVGFWNYDSTGTSLLYWVKGLQHGRDLVIASAPDRAPDTLVVRVTSPKIIAPTLWATPTVGLWFWPTYATVADSTGAAHDALDPVILRVTSSDQSVLEVDTLIQVPPGSRLSEAHIIRVVGPGTAYVTYTDTAGIYPPATTNTVTITSTTFRRSGSGLLGRSPSGGVFPRRQPTGGSHPQHPRQ